MTWPRKVSRSIQEALRVILPDDGRFPHHQPWGEGDVWKVPLHWEATEPSGGQY